jgi:hypothetical protein
MQPVYGDGFNPEATPAGREYPPAVPATPSVSDAGASPQTAPAGVDPRGSQPAPARPTAIQSLAGDIDVTNLSPGIQAQMQAIEDYRRGTPNLGMEDDIYSIEFQNAPEWVQMQQYQNLQQQTGIPWYAWQEEVEKARRQNPGASGSQIATLY